MTGVWVGKDNDEPLGVNETGSRAAIPIWLEYMKNVLEGEPIRNFPISNEVTFSKTNPETGEKTNFGDPNGRFEVFIDEKMVESNLEERNSLPDLLEENNF